MSRVLVVDDEPYIRRSLSFILTQEGYEVESAADGASAWEMLWRWRPDAVFLDLMLPLRSGYDLCQAIRSTPELAHVVVIMLTAKGQDVDRIRGLEAGADEYCTKPFSPREITLSLRELLHPGEVRASSGDEPNGTEI
jgi:DNA-binding response OmpR family regulator